MATEKKNQLVDEQTQEVERIRDIIFGSQMRTYEDKFKVIQRDLDRLQEEVNRLNEKLAEQEEFHNKKMQALQREMRTATEHLRDELHETAQKLRDEKVDKEVLGELLIELGTQLKAGGSLVHAFKDLLDAKEE